MNNFRKKYSLTAFILIFVFSVSGEPKKSDSELVENKTKEDRKKKGSGFAKIGDDEIRFLRRLLDLPPERLRMLRKTIERLENYSEEERKAFKEWNIVAKTSLYENEWIELFKETNYNGEYYWFKP